VNHGEEGEGDQDGEDGVAGPLRVPRPGAEVAAGDGVGLAFLGPQEPSEKVEKHAATAGHGEDHEGGSDDEGIDVKALGDATGDPGDHAVPAAAGEATHGGVGAGTVGVGGGLVISHGFIVRLGGRGHHRE
jgi:hypothetical protein